MGNLPAILMSEIVNFKTGWKTSEFWVTLAPVIVGVLSVFGVHVASNSLTQTIVIVWGAASVIYVAARTFLKKVQMGHAASLAALFKQIEHEAASVFAGEANKAQVPTPTVPKTVAAPVE